MHISQRAALAIGLLSLALAGGHSTSAASTCELKRLRANGERASSDLGCHRKAALKGRPVDPACLQKGVEKFAADFAQAQVFDDCAASDDAPFAGGLIDAFVGDLIETFRPSSEPSKCAAAKLASIGKTSKEILLCSAKAAPTDTPVNPNCLERAAVKLGEAFAKAESLGDCLTTGDAAVASEAVILFTVAALTPGRIQDIASELVQIETDQESLCGPAEEPPGPTINVFAANGTRDLQIDQADDKLADFTSVIQAGKGKNYTGDTRSATPQNILDDLSRLNKEDIWIFVGHGVADHNGQVIGIAGRENGEFKLVKTADIDRALRADGDAPGIVYLGACRSGALLPTFVNASTGVAIGWAETVTHEAQTQAIVTFWTTLFGSETFGAARKKAHERYKEVVQATKANLEGLLKSIASDIDKAEDGIKKAKELGFEELGKTFEALLKRVKGNEADAQSALDKVNAELANLPMLDIMAKPALGDVMDKKLKDVTD
jgi:hypothetical protein